MNNGSENRSRLILGTVQLGINYGIANVSGKPSQQKANEIVASAVANDVVRYDTARAYGESEKVLGIALGETHLADPAIISKLSPTLEEDSCEKIESDIQQSLGLLQASFLDCLMLHREEHLPLLDGEVGHLLTSLQSEGILKRIGVSVYTTSCALAALEHPLVSVLQLPASVFDRRFESAGVFKKAAEVGKEIHIRSALLQGVICMKPDNLPSSLISMSSYLTTLRTVCSEHAISPAVAALAWALHRYPAACVLFGAETASQVLENVTATQWMKNDALMSELDMICPPQDEHLLNPVHWNK